RLEHLHIVPLYDYWRDPEGAFLVMRWLRGGSVKDALANGPYKLDRAAKLLDQVAGGLAAAHAADVVHRDLKPSNLLLDEEGNAYVADFGIAKVLGLARSESTDDDKIVGSPSYLSPEQARSQPVTAQSDIYGLGVTLYEVLTGQHPFPNLTAVERMFKHVNEPLPPLESLDPLVQEDVNDVIQRATAKNPKHRYEDVLAFAAAFRQAARVGEDSAAALVEELTLREQEILHLITQGLTNREIAESLFIELSTVKWYIRQIYPKLGVHNRRQAIMRARELDLLVADEEERAEAEGTTGISQVMPPPLNPFKGLRPFETVDARDFFGREDFIQALLFRLTAGERFLAIIGPSGSGKSSLVQAGLIPALARGEIPGSERWFMAQLSPGTRPLDELEVALFRMAADQASNLRRQLERDANGLLRAADLILPKDGSELILIIDQFEELFTLTTDEAARQHFLDNLAAAVTDSQSRVRVIITLRADYYDRPLHYPQFGDLVRSRMETVLPLSAEALERAIVKPLERVGVACEAGLAPTIIDDVLYQPGGLPLLQYALTELFEERDGRVLTLQAYREIGGATGALARRAEELFLAHDGEGQEAIRQLFLRLVAIGEGIDALPDARRRVLRTELTAAATDQELMDEIIDSYAAYRLLTLDHEPNSRRPTVEVAHEALLREWERLRQWISDSQEDLFQHRRLQVLAQEWLANDRDPGWLLHRTRLDQFVAWEAESDLALTADERAFLAASIAARRDRQAEEEARRQRELETARQLAETERRRAQAQAEAAARLRRRAIYLGGALIIAAVLAVVAILASRQSALNAERAQTNANIASANEARAESEAAAAATAEAVAQEQRQIAETERDSARSAALEAAVAEALAVQEQQAAEAQARLATARELSLAAVNNLAIDPELSVLLAMRAVSQTWSTDGFALPEAEAALHRALLNLRQVQALPGSPEENCQLSIWCDDVAYNQDGTLLLASGPENTAVLWNPLSGERLAVLDGHEGPVIAVTLSTDDTRLATASADGTARVWELDLGEEAVTATEPSLILSGHMGEVTDVTFSPDGALIATASRDQTAKIWNAETGLEVTTLSGHESSVRDVLFSADGAELFTASSDTTVKIWNLASAQERLTLTGHSERVTDLALSADGSRLATVSWDSTVKVWDVVSGAEQLSLVGDTARVYSVAFSPDGRTIAAGGTDAIINLWDAETGEGRLALPGHQGLVYNLAFAPDGRHLASGAADGTIRIWDISRAGNREWLTLDGHNWVMFGVDFSPDGTKLATASWDGAVKQWDVQSGTELMTVVADEARKTAVEFSPDGRLLATAGFGGVVVLWSAESGAALYSLDDYPGALLDLALSPDGRRLAAVGENQESPGLIVVWDTETGELERSWQGHEAAIERVAISPDGQWLATASQDNTAKVWELATGGLVATLPDHQAGVTAVNFSHDGRYLGTAGLDNSARIWQLDGSEIQTVVTLQGHASQVWDVVFSPDDSQVATISFDGSVKLWDWETATERLTLPGADNNGREVAFSPDGTYLAATTGSGLVRIYVLPLDELLALAQARVARTLSTEECRQYLHAETCRPAVQGELR
ncbi:MAG: protein kinase, partial [Candidatus Promineifilaceae bacterium]|nr:protein kinase [Candidatus Promineifilaceae bacterium]